MTVTENRIRERLAADDPVYGAATMTASPAIVEVYGLLGLDFAWVDLEHAGPSAMQASALESLTRAADAADVELIVRVPSGEPDVIRKVLDCGVRTILVPRVESVEEVRTAVAATRFRYDGGAGDRGVGIGRTSQWGTFGDGYVDREDDTVCIGVMIETTDAVAAIDDIVAVPELGFAFVGPSDLSVSLERPLETTHPDVASAIETVREACLAADVPIGRIATDPATIETGLEEGYRLFRVGDEISAVRAVLSERMAGFLE